MSVPPLPAISGGDSAIGGNLAEEPTTPSSIANANPGAARGGMERAPANRGPLVSGSMSRILSGAIIYLREPKPPGPRSPRSCGLPGSHRAGSTILLGLAPGGVYPAAASPRRWCALTAPFHHCLFAAHVWPRHRLCRFCGTFPRVSPGGSYPPPCPVVSGLSSRGFHLPRDRVTRRSKDRPRQLRWEPQSVQPPTASEPSLQTGHSATPSVQRRAHEAIRTSSRLEPRLPPPRRAPRRATADGGRRNPRPATVVPCGLPAVLVLVEAMVQTFLSTPMTRPSNSASRVMIGS